MLRIASSLSITLLMTTLACAGSGPDAAADTAAAAKPEAEAEPAPAKPEPAAALTSFEAEDGRYGYKSEAGEVVIEAQFAVANEFEDQVAGVAGDDGWLFIDRSGKTLAHAFVFDNGPDEFVEGRARIVEGEGAAARYGFLATTGEIIVAPTYAWVMPYADGMAPVCEGCVREQDGEHFSMTGGKWGYVDLTGKLVIPAKYSSAAAFEGGHASVQLDDGKTLTIDKAGDPI